MLFACSTTNKTPASQTISTQTTTNHNIHTTVGQKIAALAKQQIGAPYQYGGASPNGFDCSGLVFYAHSKLGINTPRTSYAQFDYAKPVTLNKLVSGDVVFFRLNRKKISHVGIYIGKGQFVHAPSSGKKVASNDLNDPFWRSRIISAGRLY